MSHLVDPILRSPWRWPVVVLLLINAAIHLDLTPMHLIEAPYVGSLFIVLSVACLAQAVALAFADSVLVWAAAVATNALALMAFLASRTVGLPQIDDEIGNWTEPLGNLTIAVEVLTIACAVVALRSRRVHAMHLTTPVAARVTHH